METGGWTKVGNAKIGNGHNVTNESEIYWKKHLFDNVTLLREAADGQFLLSDTGLQELRQHIKFTNLRWKCTKVMIFCFVVSHF